MKEHPKIMLKQQSNDISISTYLVKVEVPSLTTNIDIFTPINTLMSNSNMSSQVHDGNFKPKFMND